ncbi:MAG: MgtC/SapB family protein [Gemmatimonadota bacterium]
MPEFVFDGSEFLSILVRVGGAYVLAIPIGWQRERTERTLGLRTFPLVAMASAAYIILADLLFSPDPNAQARVLQGLLTGIGFIGAGAILKVTGQQAVHGTATAASLWATGALGAAMAYGQLHVALLLALFVFATLRWMTPVKERIEKRAGLRPEGGGTDR